VTHPYYSTEDICALAPGVTPRKLNYWCNHGSGIFDVAHTTPGSGRHRIFDSEDLRVAQVLGHVSFSISQTFSANCSVALARDVAQAVRSGQAYADIRLSSDVGITVDIEAIVRDVAVLQEQKLQRQGAR
jgi:hypothetical protein